MKSFEKDTALRSGAGSGAIFVRDLQDRINAGPVEKAAQKLARYSGDALPRVIVLDNHRQVGVSLGTVELIQIFGSLEYGMTVDPESGRTVSEGWQHRTDDFALGRGRRPHISAVVVNISEVRFDTVDANDDFIRPRPMRVHAIHNPDATHPLPLWVFSESNDRQIVRLQNRWIEVQSPPARIRHEHIAAQAYELYEARGRADGFCMGDWLQAERELRDALAF